MNLNHELRRLTDAHRCTLTGLCLGVRKTMERFNSVGDGRKYSDMETADLIKMLCVNGCNLASNHSHEDLPCVYYHSDFFQRSWRWYQVVTAPLWGPEHHHRLHMLRRVPEDESVADSMRAALDSMGHHECLVTDGNKLQFNFETIYDLHASPLYWDRLYIHPFGLRLLRQGSTERIIRQLDQYMRRTGRNYGEMTDQEVEQVIFEQIGSISRIIH